MSLAQYIFRIIQDYRISIYLYDYKYLNFYWQFTYNFFLICVATIRIFWIISWVKKITHYVTNDFIKTDTWFILNMVRPLFTETHKEWVKNPELLICGIFSLAYEDPWMASWIFGAYLFLWIWQKGLRRFVLILKVVNDFFLKVVVCVCGN